MIQWKHFLLYAWGFAFAFTTGSAQINSFNRASASPAPTTIAPGAQRAPAAVSPTTTTSKLTATPAPPNTNPVIKAASSNAYELQLRYWHADWSWDGENNKNDLGASPFGQIGLAYRTASYDLFGHVGYGNGWGQEITRLDLSLGINWNADLFSYGLGARRMGFDSAYDDSKWSYLGPELMGGYETMLGDSDYSFHLDLTAGYYVWDFSDGTLDADGGTFGYAADIGFGYVFRSATLRAGYRAQFVTEDDPSPQDEFMGPYAEVKIEL